MGDDQRIDDEVRLTTSTVYSLFRDKARWPTFAVVDRRLDRVSGRSAQELLAATPTCYLSTRPRSGNYRDDEPIILTLCGLDLVPEAGDDLGRLAAMVAWLAQSEQTHDPQDSGEPFVASSTDAAMALGLELGRDDHVKALTRLRPLAELLTPAIAGSSWSQDGATWSLTVSRGIRVFRQRSTVQDLLDFAIDGQATEPHPLATDAPIGVSAPDNASQNDRRRNDLRSRTALRYRLRATLGESGYEIREDVAAENRGLRARADLTVDTPHGTVALLLRGTAPAAPVWGNVQQDVALAKLVLPEVIDAWCVIPDQHEIGREASWLVQESGLLARLADAASGAAAATDGAVAQTVVVLGDFSHEGLTAKIESLGFAVANKSLRSSPRNWQRIVEMLRLLNENGRLALVFGYLPTPTMLEIASSTYDEVRPRLMAELERTKTLLFVYEDNLEGVVEPLPWELDDRPDRQLELEDVPWRTTNGYRRLPNRHEWLAANAQLIERALRMLTDWMAASIDVVPFRKRSDVTIRMFEALDEAQAGVFLRLYVPHGRYQSEQLEDFLTLFTRYLRDVEGKEFSVDVERTHRGTTYVFKGRGEASSVEDLRAATARFDNFLVLAQSDAKAAEQALMAAGAAQGEAVFIVAKYARSFRRLQLEIRHEYERRSLALTHQMQSELLDAGDSGTLPVPLDEKPSSLLSVVGNSAPVTVNIGAGALATNSAVRLDGVVSGGVQYNESDRELLQLIEQVQDDLAAVQLRSALDRLKDPATSPEEKRTGIQKLKSFVYAAGRTAGKKLDKIGTEVLIAYLNSLVVGGPKP